MAADLWLGRYLHVRKKVSQYLHIPPSFDFRYQPNLAFFSFQPKDWVCLPATSGHRIYRIWLIIVVCSPIFPSNSRFYFHLGTRNGLGGISANNGRKVARLPGWSVALSALLQDLGKRRRRFSRNSTVMPTGPGHQWAWAAMESDAVRSLSGYVVLMTRYTVRQ